MENSNNNNNNGKRPKTRMETTQKAGKLTS